MGLKDGDLETQTISFIPPKAGNFTVQLRKKDGSNVKGTHHYSR
jgi:hypothetical protein